MNWHQLCCDENDDNYVISMKIDFPTLDASTAIQFGSFCIKNLPETGFLFSKYLMSTTTNCMTLKFLYLIVSNQYFDLGVCANIDAVLSKSNYSLYN